MTDVARVMTRFASATTATLVDDAYALTMATDGYRADASLTATLERPTVVRDALTTLFAIRRADLRRHASNRADYLTYLLSKGKRATKELWDAQRAFLDERYGDAVGIESPLDPLVTVDGSGLAFEAFSTDESIYARLHLRAGEAYRAASMTPGTSHVLLANDLPRVLSPMRSYRPATLTIAPSTEGDDRAIDVPYRWLRAFGQVQAASTLPGRRFSLAPVDFYNLLFVLRMRRARTSPRALRYELVPGEPPRMVLEPWETLIQATSGPYEGDTPQVVRTWGRRRLGALARLLPHTTAVRVHVTGPGLPSWYVLELPGATLSVALSGWTDRGWAGVANFDLLAAGPVDEVLAARILERVRSEPGATIEDLVQATGRPEPDVRSALLRHVEAGAVVHDVAQRRFLHRPLLADPLPRDKVRFRDHHEARAHRLLATEGAVRLTRIHDLGGEGVRVEGEVADAEAHRNYTTGFTIDREGRTVDATCTSPQFRRSGLREGPTVPMIALRIRYARQRAELEHARQTDAGRKLIRAETRVFTRRDGARSTTVRVSLDDRHVVVRWGDRPDRMRMQRLVFDAADGARDEYFTRLDRLARRGFIDATAAEGSA